MKRKIVNALVLSISGTVFFSLLFGFTLFQGKPWRVPDNYKNMKNPVKSDASVLSDAKALYSTHCKSCHEAKGLGDGNKAAQLKTDPGDFSIAAFQSQSDGSLFYKLSEGRDDMPEFKKKIPDADDRWSIVLFFPKNAEKIIHLMEHNTSQPGRKKFLLWGATLLSSFTVLKFITGKKKPAAPVETVKMLTQDGRLVEVDKKLLVKGNKISNEELQHWIKKNNNQ